MGGKERQRVEFDCSSSGSIYSYIINYPSRWYTIFVLAILSLRPPIPPTVHLRTLPAPFAHNSHSQLPAPSNQRGHPFVGISPPPRRRRDVILEQRCDQPQANVLQEQGKWRHSSPMSRRQRVATKRTIRNSDEEQSLSGQHPQAASAC